MWTTTAAAAVVLLLALSITATADASPAPAPTDCASRADGFYARGCSGAFDACAAGRVILMDCPADLVFDETRQQCEYPGNVAACGGEAPEEGSGSGDGSGDLEEGSGSEGSGTEGSGEEGSGEIEDISGACESRADGFYRLQACGSAFLGCSGGVAWRMACPASLKYDEENEQCDYPGNVEGCNEGSGEGSGEEVDGSGSEGSGSEGSGSEGSGSEGSGSEGSGTEEEGSGVESDETIDEKQIETDEIIVTSKAHHHQDEQKQQQEEEDVELKETETEDDIIDESSNGVEVEKEQEDVKELEAEDDIIDDNSSSPIYEQEQEEIKEMEAEDDVIEEQQPVEEAKPEEEDVASEETEEEPAATVAAPAAASSAVQHDDTDDSAARSCAGRGDGFYALGCSSEMLACTNGRAIVMPCPAGLVFDERNQMCDFTGNVAACADRDALLTEDSLLTGNTEQHPEIPRARDSAPAPDATLAPTTPAGMTASAPSAYVSATNAPLRASDARPRKNRRDARCKSADGQFALACSPEFVSCRAGVATKLECAEDEAFEETEQSCVPLARHPHCFSHARQADDVIDADVQMEREKDDGADLKMPIDHSFACDWAGARAESSCADWFRLCEAGRGIEMFCLQGHLFDGSTGRCVPAGQLPHCQAQ